PLSPDPTLFRPSRMAGKPRRSRKARSRKKKTGSRRWLRWLLRPMLFVLGLSLGLLGPWVWWLDREVSLRFADRHLTEASRVYARPLELHDGLAFSRRDLLIELEAAGLRAGATGQPGRFRIDGDRIDLHLQAFDFPDGRQAAQRASLRLQGGRVDLLGETSIL